MITAYMTVPIIAPRNGSPPTNSEKMQEETQHAKHAVRDRVRVRVRVKVRVRVRVRVGVGVRVSVRVRVWG